MRPARHKQAPEKRPLRMDASLRWHDEREVRVPHPRAPAGSHPLPPASLTLSSSRTRGSSPFFFPDSRVRGNDGKDARAPVPIRPRNVRLLPRPVAFRRISAKNERFGAHPSW